MHNPKSHGIQAGGMPKGFSSREKLALLAALNVIEDAVADICSGHYVRAADDLRVLTGSILDEARADLADLRSLRELPPLHHINTALHVRRQALLERRAKAERWSFKWEGADFIVADNAVGLWLTIDPSDNWTASPSGSPDWLICGSGLLSLIAFLNGSSIAEEASRYAAWHRKGGRQ
jgi:hypothetical protein